MGILHPSFCRFLSNELHMAYDAHFGGNIRQNPFQRFFPKNKEK
jgi:hypothetical protein